MYEALTGPLSDPHRRALDQSFSEDDAAVGLLSRSGKLLNEAAVIGCTECPQVQPRLQFRQVLPAGSRTLCVLRPAVRLDVQLPSDKGQQGRGPPTAPGRSVKRLLRGFARSGDGSGRRGRATDSRRALRTASSDTSPCSEVT